MQFTQGFHRAMQLHPHKVATLCEDRRLTFAEIEHRVSRLAGALQSRGIAQSTPVALLSLNSDFYLQYYLCCAWGGFVANPVNFRWNVQEIIYSIKDSQSQVIFLDDTFIDLAEQLLAECPSLRYVYYCGHQSIDNAESVDQLIRHHDPIDDVGVGGDTLFGIFYTGGTTGFPKGVLLSHDNICTSGLGFLAEGAFPEGSVGLHAAPMFHLADMAQTIGLLLRGGTHVMLPAFSPEACLSVIATHRVTDLLLVPTMLQMMIESPAMASVEISSLRRIYYGGSPFTESGIERTLAVLPGVEMMQVYGMTESSATISFLPWHEHLPGNQAGQRLRSAGRAFPHTQIQVVDADDQPLAPGVTGEIVFRSPGMMLGYLNQLEQTDSALRGGWMHTGDAGYIDEQGFLYVVDRLKDMIISGGENIYCTEVENAISTHPDILTCAVFGVRDDQWGERVHAALVLRPGCDMTLEILLQHCRESIAGYKCPRSFTVHQRLPLTGAGKVKKNELRDLLASKSDS